MCSVPIETPDGAFRATFTSFGLSRLEFPNPHPSDAVTAQTSPPTPELRRWVTLTRRALEHALRAKPPGNLPPLDLRSGTEFQRAVWQELLALPPGTTVTYQELATRTGRRKAARAVGGACGANPIPVLVPCHRVLAAGSKLGGFTSGLDWKRRLLHREGVELRLRPRPQEAETSR